MTDLSTKTAPQAKPLRDGSFINTDPSAPSPASPDPAPVDADPYGFRRLRAQAQAQSLARRREKTAARMRALRQRRRAATQIVDREPSRTVIYAVEPGVFYEVDVDRIPAEIAPEAARRIGIVCTVNK